MAPKPLLLKIVTCFIAGLTCAALLLLLGNSGTVRWFPPIIVFSFVGIVLLSAIVFPFIWQYNENRSRINSEKVYCILYALIRYCIAFNLASFGWKKVFGLQFVVPAEIASRPMNEQSGEWLTWYYFGYSATFGFIIATLQIVFSWLLLLRRTMLFAGMVLFSMMLHLSLINVFYEMNAGALVQSSVTTIGILFLLLLEYKKIVAFFFETGSQMPSITNTKLLSKKLVHFLVIVLSLLFTIYLKASSDI
jgi:hypothetical protein